MTGLGLAEVLIVALAIAGLGMDLLFQAAESDSW